MIKVDNISKSYNGFVALAKTSFTLQSGNIVGLLGVNGAGKSTIMKILAGIIIPDTGDVHFQGDKYSEKLPLLKQRIGYLSEDNPLYDDMYVQEYLNYVAAIYGAGKNKVSDLIGQIGLQKEYKKKIKVLSKGNRQRVGIAQALINDPFFLIMDEPTGGLDPAQRESLNNLFLELSKDKVILFSTHILHEIKELCTQFLVVDQGKLIAEKHVEDIRSIEETFHNLIHEHNS